MRSTESYYALLLGVLEDENCSNISKDKNGIYRNIATPDVQYHICLNRYPQDGVLQYTTELKTEW